MDNLYFGQGCKYFLGQWDHDDPSKSGIPELVYCRHPNNVEECEGNCNRRQCPLLKERKN